MRDGELLYFTPAEFILMMELSGSGRYSLLQPPDPEPDDCAFLEAFSSLFRRGMLLREEENIREVIAFPMSGTAQDLMCGAPNEVTEQQLREVHIKVRD